MAELLERVVELPPPVLVVTVDLPGPQLRPNLRRGGSRGAAIKQSSQNAEARDAAAFSCMGELRSRRADPPELERAAVRLRYHHRTKRQRDPDNLIAAGKPVFDGLQLAKVVGNDANLVHLPPIDRVDRKRPRLEVEVFALDLRFEVVA